RRGCSPPCRCYSQAAVLMDIRMPGMDGLKPPRPILGSKPGRGCRIIIPTTFDLDQYVYAALTPGRAGSCTRTPRPSNSSPGQRQSACCAKTTRPGPQASITAKPATSTPHPIGKDHPPGRAEDLLCAPPSSQSSG